MITIIKCILSYLIYIYTYLYIYIYSITLGTDNRDATNTDKRCLSSEDDSSIDSVVPVGKNKRHQRKAEDTPTENTSVDDLSKYASTAG